LTHYPYLILGGGMAADAAVRGIRELDAERPIGLIGAEPSRASGAAPRRPASSSISGGARPPSTSTPGG
jgi:hypothetical protein